MDLEKYRSLFLEEATEHLAELSRALIVLEKDAGAVEAIEGAFRAAHSIKSMAASLSYDSIRDLAHRLEDRMEAVRSAGRVEGADDLALLFRGLEALEAGVDRVRESGEPGPADAELLRALASPGGDAAPAAPERSGPAAEEPQKKA